jgi:hypothetical protein
MCSVSSCESVLTVWRRTASCDLHAYVFILLFPINFGLRICFWTLMDRSLFVRVWELESSDIFIGRVDGLWWFGGGGGFFQE